MKHDPDDIERRLAGMVQAHMYDAEPYREFCRLAGDALALIRELRATRRSTADVVAALPSPPLRLP